jgi:hypothetical protein
MIVGVGKVFLNGHNQTFELEIFRAFHARLTAKFAGVTVAKIGLEGVGKVLVLRPQRGRNNELHCRYLSAASHFV